MRIILLGLLVSLSACVSGGHRHRGHACGCHTHIHARDPGTLLLGIAVHHAARGIARRVRAADRAPTRGAVPRTAPRHGVAMVKPPPARQAGLDRHVGRRVRVERSSSAPLEGALRGHTGTHAFVLDDAGRTHQISAMEIETFAVIDPPTPPR